MSCLMLAAALAASSASVDALPSLSKRQAPPGVPQFVLDYAPLVNLHPQDHYLPFPLTTHLSHVHPLLNFTAPDPAGPDPLSLSNLADLNNIPNSNGGQDIYLSSNDDFTQLPGWLGGVKPAEGDGSVEGACVVVVNEKGEGVVDAFYFYFYSYDQGNKVLGHELGDHVGDWEHNAIRFQNSTPTSLWFSAHSNGEAFTYSAVHKSPSSPKRPVVYSANGTHANWATVGTHDHTIPDISLPNGLLQDYTDDGGPVWDPVKGALFYKVTFAEGTADGSEDGMEFEAYEEGGPTGFLEFKGEWGDKELDKSDKRQDEFFGIRKYTNGPTGPQDKKLNRKDICPDNGVPCVVRDSTGPGT